MDNSVAAARRKSPLTTPTDLGSNATRDIASALTALLADVFALYISRPRIFIGTFPVRISGTITSCSMSRVSKYSQ
jgi:hypothetical protein